MVKKQEEEKIDIFNAHWRDQFEDDFYFVRGAVDLTLGCSSQEVGISDGSIPAVLEEAMNRLDNLHSLVTRVSKSIFEITLVQISFLKRSNLDSTMHVGA